MNEQPGSSAHRWNFPTQANRGLEWATRPRQDMFEKKKLVKETEWTRVYSVGPNQLYYESKFLLDRLEVTAADIKGRWPNLSREERMDFVQAFAAKYPYSPDDEQILEFLMEAGDESVWSTIALPLVRLSTQKREKALAFLTHQAAEADGVRANYYQALALMDDKRCIPVLKEQWSRLKQLVSTNTPLESFNDIFLYLDYLTCCAALYRLDGSEEYRTVIEQMKKHSDERVRAQAKLAMRAV